MDAPGVGVSAVLVEDGRVLLVRRGRAPASGMWSFPGGRLELGESVNDGVRREVEEECGLQIVVGPLLDVVEVQMQEHGTLFHWIVLDYLATRVHGSVVAGDDAVEARWCSMSDIEAMPTTPRVPEIAARALAARRAWHPTLPPSCD